MTQSLTSRSKDKNWTNRNHKELGSSTVFVELGEADHYPLLKVEKITESVTHAFHCFNGIINPFNNARCIAMSKII